MATVKFSSKKYALDAINCFTTMAVSVPEYPAEKVVQNPDAELELKGSG